MKQIALILALMFVGTAHALAWDGTDTATGASVEIEKGNLVRSGNSIEVYRSDTGEYEQYTVDDISSVGSGVEIEATNDTTGEPHTFDMDGN
jgi:hypothetical protein